jgi:hypothetical protein
MDLCDFCGQPKALHVGFDHGKRKCLLAFTRLNLVIFFGEARAREIIREVNEWREASLYQGAYI